MLEILNDYFAFANLAKFIDFPRICYILTLKSFFSQWEPSKNFTGFTTMAKSCNIFSKLF